MSCDKGYRQIVILSGKGGTGKTTFSSAFSKLLEKKITVDCDVDGANLYLILNHERQNEAEFFGGKKAQIDYEKCVQCGTCESVCRFDAISDFKINLLSCEGCGFCYRACPEKAISFKSHQSGSYFECKLEDESKFFYARLLPGEGNSGKLVSEIKKKALEKNNKNIDWVIVDGPPGIGCPVNASLSEADFAVIVTEPTLSAIHDLKRLVQLLKIFKIPSGVIINKYDLNNNLSCEIQIFSKEEKTPILGLVPFNPDFTAALRMNKSIIELNPRIEKDIKNIWSKIEHHTSISKN